MQYANRNDPTTVGIVNEAQQSAWVRETLGRLAQSQFRTQFALSDKDRAYARAKGKTVIGRHAHDMLRARVGDTEPRNEGMPPPPAAGDALRNGIIFPRAGS